jgi:hypothetical protein
MSTQGKAAVLKKLKELLADPECDPTKITIVIPKTTGAIPVHGINTTMMFQKMDAGQQHRHGVQLGCHKSTPGGGRDNKEGAGLRRENLICQYTKKNGGRWHAEFPHGMKVVGKHRCSQPDILFTLGRGTVKVVKKKEDVRKEVIAYITEIFKYLSMDPILIYE